jgi:hypothetical protein
MVLIYYLRTGRLGYLKLARMSVLYIMQESLFNSEWIRRDSTVGNEHE